MKKQRYSVVIQWSDEDEVYVVTLPEWGCHTHGATYAEAAKNAEEVLQLLVEGEEEAGRSLPAPHGFMFPGPSGFTYELNQFSLKPSNTSDDRVRTLLQQLAATTDNAEKRRIRSQLRSLGHRGGSRSQPQRPALNSFRRASA